MTTALVPKEERNTLDNILKRPAFVARFSEVLKDRAPQFMSSILSVGRTMPDVEPMSIVASSMIAATLDLPIEKNLGFAWIVPYRDGNNGKVAQFQIGYKGLIQLALRTGRYLRMNAVAVNQEAVGGYDEVGEPIIDWSKIDATQPTIGYVFAFKLVNGFSKICYWTKKKVEAHAQRYSQAYRSKYDGPWKTDFDKMALKTVISNELSDWGILSVEWQTMKKYDQAVVTEVGGEATFIDNPQIGEGENANAPEPTEMQRATQAQEPAKAATTAAQATSPAAAPATPGAQATAPTASEPPAERPKRQRRAAGPETPAPAAAPTPAPAPTVMPDPTPANPDEEEEAAAGLAPAQPAAVVDPPGFTPINGESEELTALRREMHIAGATEAQLLAFGIQLKFITPGKKLAEHSTEKHKSILHAWPNIAMQVLAIKK